MPEKEALVHFQLLCFSLSPLQIHIYYVIKLWPYTTCLNTENALNLL